MPRRGTGGRKGSAGAGARGAGKEKGGEFPLWPGLSAAAQPGLTSLNTFQLAASLIANTTDRHYLKCFHDKRETLRSNKRFYYYCSILLHLLF